MGLYSLLEGVLTVLGRLDPPLRAALAADAGGSQLPFLFQAGFLLLKREMIDYEAVARVWESCFVQGAIASEVYLLAGLLRLQRRAIVTSSGAPAALESLVQLFNQLGGTVESASLLRMARVTREAF